MKFIVCTSTRAIFSISPILSNSFSLFMLKFWFLHFQFSVSFFHRSKWFYVVTLKSQNILENGNVISLLVWLYFNNNNNNKETSVNLKVRSFEWFSSFAHTNKVRCRCLHLFTWIYACAHLSGCVWVLWQHQLYAYV